MQSRAPGRGKRQQRADDRAIKAGEIALVAGQGEQHGFAGQLTRTNSVDCRTAGWLQATHETRLQKVIQHAEGASPAIFRYVPLKQIGRASCREREQISVVAV